jgi:hypothetical protein
MVKGEPFKIDINNPAEIEAALKDADVKVVALTASLNETMAQLTWWKVMRQRLALLSGESASKTTPGGGSIRSQVEQIVKDSETPVGAEWVLQLLPGASRKTVSWNLWDLERKGKIRKVSDGVYARLDFKPEKVATLLDNGS